jgi:hypothetical protein
MGTKAAMRASARRVLRLQPELLVLTSPVSLRGCVGEIVTFCASEAKFTEAFVCRGLENITEIYFYGVVAPATINR